MLGLTRLKSWLKNKLREWLLEDDAPASIQINTEDGVRDAIIIRAVGMALMVSVKNGQRVVTEAQATDRRKFRKAVKFWGDQSQATWEDGSKAEL